MQEINKAKQESSAQSTVKPIGQLPKLIVLCGPSHAGKTTLAQRLCRSFTVISSDEIRKRLPGSFEGSKRETKVWNAFESMKCEALKKNTMLFWMPAIYRSGRGGIHCKALMIIT